MALGAHGLSSHFLRDVIIGADNRYNASDYHLLASDLLGCWPCLALLGSSPMYIRQGWPSSAGLQSLTTNRPRRSLCLQIVAE